MVTKLDKVLYTAHAKSTGGRDGRSAAADGHLDVKLDPPKEMGGKGDGTNPGIAVRGGLFRLLHRLHQGGGAQPEDQRASRHRDRRLVSIGPIPQGFGISADLKVHIPGMDKAAAEKLVEAAHQVCPYSNATRGNIEVTLSVI